VSSVSSAAGSSEPRVDLILIVGRDARKALSRIPEALRGVPVIALTSPDFSNEALANLGAMSIGGRSDDLAGETRPHESGVSGSGTGRLVDGQRLIGESPAVQQIKSSIEKVAATDANVLITGETGTGKELIAELIQRNSKRRSDRYVCINCAAVPDSLLESELFGYERGAFTGAQQAGEGKLEGAQGGTVFFDEIGDMSLYAQAKILRLIETREIQRLGSKRPTRLDFRLIAATNIDIDSHEGASRFRRDLYFRLNVARIHIPPLRERKSDIPLLIRHFVRHFSGQFGRHVDGFGEDAMRGLLRHEWPGNIRELKNTVEASFVNLAAGETRLKLPDQLERHFCGDGASPSSEQERLITALWATGWNKSKAARQLQWSRMTLYRKMVKYRVEHGSQCRPAQSATAGG
jgi:two-component system response regulator HydG/two-component system response regulator AtoC